MENENINAARATTAQSRRTESIGVKAVCLVANAARINMRATVVLNVFMAFVFHPNRGRKAEAIPYIIGIAKEFSVFFLLSFFLFFSLTCNI